MIVGASIARPFQQIDTAVMDERCSPLHAFYCRSSFSMLYYINKEVRPWQSSVTPLPYSKASALPKPNNSPI